MNLLYTCVIIHAYVPMFTQFVAKRAQSTIPKSRGVVGARRLKGEQAAAFIWYRRSRVNTGTIVCHTFDRMLKKKENIVTPILCIKRISEDATMQQRALDAPHELCAAYFYAWLVGADQAIQAKYLWRTSFCTVVDGKSIIATHTHTRSHVNVGCHHSQWEVDITRIDRSASPDSAKICATQSVRIKCRVSGNVWRCSCVLHRPCGWSRTPRGDRNVAALFRHQTQT